MALLTAAEARGVQFKLDMCLWVQLEVPLLGFVLGNGARRVEGRGGAQLACAQVRRRHRQLQRLRQFHQG
eukprot:4735216-Pyramimonas_sp.AAC.1